ncbi:hypothetical protein BH23ACT5_BH23ACT5_15460 [soil metagenome]
MRERDHLIDGLDQRLASAVESRGSIVFLSGEAGAGKTTLIREWMSRIEWGTVVLEGACDPLVTPRPLSPVLDIATNPESGLTALVAAGADPSQLFTTFLAQMNGSIRPTVVVLEDIHWAGGGTLDFIRFLGRRLRDTKAVLICTYRDDEVGPGHPLRPVMGDLATKAPVFELVVEPLSLDAVRKMVGVGRIDPEHLHRITGGNPFYVTEVLATGEELPTSVQNSILARLSRIGERARAVCEAVAAAPRYLEVDVALALAGATGEDADEAITAGAITAEEGVLRFRHEVARAAVEDAIPSVKRLRLHRQLLEVLRQADSIDLARLAHHAVCAQADDLVVEYAPRAARLARKRRAH